jgi:signal peptidase I
MRTFAATRLLPPPPGWWVRLRFFLLLEAGVALAIFVTFMALAGAPRLLGYSSFIVYGSSMEPAVQRGSIAVAAPLLVEALSVGDIVPYRTSAGSAPTLHRIVAIEDTAQGRQFTLKGDANERADPQRVVLEGKGSRVVYTVPQVGYFANLARKGPGQVLLIWLPAAVLSALLLWEIWAQEPKPRPLWIRWL